MNINKNLSVSEHIDKLNNRFLASEPIASFSFDLMNVGEMKRHNSYLMKKISSHEFDKYFHILKNTNQSVILNPIIIKNMLKKENFLYIYNNKKLSNIFENTYLIENKYIVKDSESNELTIDTLFFDTFYLNNKTINAFSYLILTNVYNIYLMKRSDLYYIFVKEQY